MFSPDVVKAEIKATWERSGRGSAAGKYPPKALKEVLWNADHAKYADSLREAVRSCFTWEGFRAYPAETHPELTLEPPGEDPELLAALAERQAQIRKLSDQIDQIQREKDELRTAAILRMFPNRQGQRFETNENGWFCDASPTGTCVYTNEDGEECIICGNPEERK